jgi:DNA-binding transcriptional regulator YdaS (Cro superfamily)
MDKAYAIKLAGSETELARLLGVSRQAVNQWGEQLPRLQVYRLRELKPGWWRKWRRSILVRIREYDRRV